MPHNSQSQTKSIQMTLNAAVALLEQIVHFSIQSCILSEYVPGCFANRSNNPEMISTKFIGRCVGDMKQKLRTENTGSLHVLLMFFACHFNFASVIVGRVAFHFVK